MTERRKKRFDAIEQKRHFGTIASVKLYYRITGVFLRKSMQAKDFCKEYPGKLAPIGGGLCAFVPNPLPDKVDFLGSVKNEHERALIALGKLGAIIPTLPNPELLTQPFMRREAVLSSKIEGTKTGVGQLYLFETETKLGSQMDEAEAADAREVWNYVLALEHGLKELPRMPVCNRLIRGMHEILMDGVTRERGQDPSPGQFRDRQVYIGKDGIDTARYVAPPESTVLSLMNSLELYINEEHPELPSLVKIALIHYQFEAIHPFRDGNGRLGRLLISLLLSSMNILEQPLLYLSAFFERHKEDYVSNLWEVSRSGNWRQWVSFFLQGVIEESHDAVDRARTLMALKETYRQRLQRPKKTSASALALVDFLFRWPIVSVPEVAKELDMTYKGALKNVEKLVALEVLKENKSRKWNKLYIASDIIKILA